MKLRKVHKSQGYYKMKVMSDDDSDGEWKPDQYSNQCSVSIDERDTGQKQSSQESGGESDAGKNDCPVCRKSFSRSAALICHIKQNHSYMLSKKQGDSSTVHSMKKEVLEWKNRYSNEKKHSVTNETSFDNASLKADKNSCKKAARGSSIKTSNCEVLDENNDKFPIIGGSAFGDGDESVKPSNARTSILSFDDSNAELLDPDQSFSIVRRGLKKTVKNKDMEKCKPSIVKKVLFKPAEKKVPVNFASIDFSIENSDADQKNFECSVCDMCFSSSSLLTYHHMRKHMADDFQQCQDCGSVFYSQSLFTAHCNLHVS